MYCLKARFSGVNCQIIFNEAKSLITAFWNGQGVHVLAVSALHIWKKFVIIYLNF